MRDARGRRRFGHDAILDALEAIVVAAASGAPTRGAVVRGPDGAGASTTVQRLIDRLADLPDATWNVVRLDAASVPTDAPLAWLAPLRGPGLDRSDRVSLVHELRASLARRARHGPVLVTVDHADRLTRADQGVLERLVADSGVVVVATTSDAAEARRTFATPIHEEWLEVLDVPPLAPADVSRLAADRLGGPVDDHLVDHLVRTSGRLPMLVDELLVADLARDALARRGPTWTLVGQPARVPTLPGLVLDRVTSLDPEARALVEVLAIAGPLPDLPELRGQVDAAGVDRLRAAGILTAAAPDPNHPGLERLALAHPMIAAVTVGGETPATRHDAATRAVAALRALPHDDPDRTVRIARVALAHGIRVDDETLLSGARRALRQLDAPLAEHLLVAVSSTSWDGWFLLGHARAVQGHLDGAERALERAVMEADSDERRARAASRRANVWSRDAGRVDDAIAALDQVAPDVGDPGWRRFVEVERAQHLLLAGRPAAAADATLHAIAQVTGVADAALTAARRCDGDRCEELVSQGLATAHLVRHGRSDARERLMLARWGRLTLDGRSAEARATIRAELERARPGDPHVVPWLAARAVDRLLDGDLRRAGDEAERAAEAVVTASRHDLAPLIAALRANIAARATDADGARSLLASIGDQELTGVTGHVVALTHAWIEAAAGRRHRAADLAARAARHARATQDHAVAALAAHDTARLGRPDLALSVLESLPGPSGTGLVHVWRDHARALATQDATALGAVVDRLTAVGCTASAVEAALAAAVLLDTAGHATDAVRVRRRAGALLDHLGPIRTVPAGSVTDLTELERRIAVLAAHRHPPSHIATDLDLPTAVVTDVLDGVRRKLGVHSRRGLDAHLAALGSTTIRGRDDPDPDASA